MRIWTFIGVLLGLSSCSMEVKHEKTAVLETESVETNTENQELFEILKEKDSLLFQVGFNQIDTAQVAILAAKDFEFYHDEHGVTETKEAFVHSIAGLHDLPFKTWRVLVDGSIEVFPLYKNNKQELYGAIQNGTHDFYQQIDGEEARKTNTARFTHLWLLEKDEWKLKRVLSFDHQVPE